MGLVVVIRSGGLGLMCSLSLLGVGVTGKYRSSLVERGHTPIVIIGLGYMELV